MTLDEEDLVEFVGLLQRRETLRFLAADGRRLPFLRTAFPAAVVFAARTLRLLAAWGPEGGAGLTRGWGLHRRGERRCRGLSASTT